VFIVEFFHVVE